jgi:hypothetical protein
MFHEQVRCQASWSNESISGTGDVVVFLDEDCVGRHIGVLAELVETLLGLGFEFRRGEGVQMRLVSNELHGYPHMRLFI